ncbi:hypothetical protein CAC42_3129 [Sphaceloma murrayae]|uniref:Uncharacterized protein n=1 Tax=Sphaceloma murrayae TaxID=2082308 RepID=A0A2K1QRM9_9PEZI|nr:hypothetical protein CAC42_3129 [Sphaceloma murrayae]
MGSNQNQNQKVFSGRGGAGNVAPVSPALKPADLETPTIKQANYTTGRGGSGNIVSNDSAENARKAQDVDLPSVAKEASAEEKPGFFGRGGAANVVKKVKEAVGTEKKAEGSK